MKRAAAAVDAGVGGGGGGVVFTPTQPNMPEIFRRLCTFVPDAFEHAVGRVVDFEPDGSGVRVFVKNRGLSERDRATLRDLYTRAWKEWRAQARTWKTPKKGGKAQQAFVAEVQRQQQERRLVDEDDASAGAHFLEYLKSMLQIPPPSRACDAPVYKKHRAAAAVFDRTADAPPPISGLVRLALQALESDGSGDAQ